MDDNKNVKYIFKIIIIGDTSVGKTNISYRFCRGEFTTDIESTVGLDFLNKYITIDNTLINIQLWDTAGSEKFRSVTRTYYKNSACALIVYDVSRKDTFNNVTSWIEDCKKYNGKNIYIILVGNKDDLKNREVTEEEGKELADRFGLKFFETSALNGHNIEEVFIDACTEINNKIKNEEIDIDDISYGVMRSDDGIDSKVEKKNGDFKLEKNDKENKNNKKKSCC